MLTLTGQRSIAGANVYPDDADPYTWYYMVQAPTVALDSDGRPIFSLVVYRRDLDHLSEEDRLSKLGGGVLSFSVELKPTDEQLTTIRETLAADPATASAIRGNRWFHLGGGLDPQSIGERLKLVQVPVSAGTVGVAVLGEGEETEGSEFVGSLVGVGPANTVGDHRASFMAKLSYCCYLTLPLVCSSLE